MTPLRTCILLSCLLSCICTAAIAAEIPLRLVAEPWEEVYKESGGTRLKLFICYPPKHIPGMKTPAIVFLHGGGWIDGEPQLFFPHARYFASRGMVAFCVEYRLTSMTGVTVADCIEDCASAMRYIRLNAERFGVDPNRIAVLGDSAGGHLAACLGVMGGRFDSPDEDRSVRSTADAMILCNPVVDSTPPGLLEFVPDRPLRNEPGLTRAEIARLISPLFSVKPGQPPALVMHGLDDEVVPPDQSRRFAEAMRKAGNRCDLVLLPNTRHGFIVPNFTATDEQVVNAVRRVDEFLRSLGYLKGKPTLVAR
jgi:acetyl esterase